jgi:hypothetical protein
MRTVLPEDPRKEHHSEEHSSVSARRTERGHWYSGAYLARVFARRPAQLLALLAFVVVAGILIYVFAAGQETNSLNLSSGVLVNTVANANGSVQLSPASTTPPPPGFTQVFDDEFNGTTLSSSWVQYDGTEGPCCVQNVWKSYNLSVSGGLLNLATKKDSAGIIGWTSAGTSMGKSLNQTYGEWDIRVRADKGKGVAFAMLIWPQTGGTPPELDFDEESPSDGAARDLLTATTHYSGGQLHHKETVDLTQWHTISVRWIPTEIDYMIDGTTWAKDTTGVPKVPMHLALQAEVGSKGSDKTQPDSTTPNPTLIQVDWVHVYSYNKS